MLVSEAASVAIYVVTLIIFKDYFGKLTILCFCETSC